MMHRRLRHRRQHAGRVPDGEAPPRRRQGRLARQAAAARRWSRRCPRPAHPARVVQPHARPCRAVKAGGGSVGQNVLRETVVWWLLVAAVGSYVLVKTNWGNWIFAVGGNKDAARAVGVPANQVKIGLFVTVSVCGCLAGTLIALRYGTVQANQGTGLEFEYIIAAVVGGCLMTGGYGSVIGAALGAVDHGHLGRRCADHRSGTPTVASHSSAACCCSPFSSTTSPARRRRRHDDLTDDALRCRQGEHALLELRNICKYFGNVTALERHHHQGRGRQGHLRARRQRRRQVDVHQDPVRRAPAELRRVHDVRQAGALHVAARCAQRRHRRGVPGPGPGAADVGVAQLLPRRRADARSASSCAARS